MLIRRSRRWVKDRLPAFICRETSWWVTRWIQCHVFLCPECRKEYRSLKAVWDKLDGWRVEEPESEIESCFVENFKQKYPGAYQEVEAQTTASGFWLPRVAFLCVLALLGLAVLWSPQSPVVPVRTVNVESPAEPSATDPQLADSSISAELPPIEVQIAATPSPVLQPFTEEVVASAPQWVDRAPSNLNALPPGSRIRITSTLEPVSSQQEFRSPMRSRTIEINDMPVSGFESLTRPYAEDRPY